MDNVLSADYSVYVEENISYSWHFNYSNDVFENSLGFEWNFFLVLIVIVIVFGIVGNTLCAIIFAQNDMRPVTDYLIFLLLAVVNTASLVISLANIYLLPRIALSTWHCITLQVFTQAVHELDDLLIMMASFVRCKSSCCSCCQSNKGCCYRNVWFYQPCFIVTLCFVLLVLIVSNIYNATNTFTSLMGCYSLPSLQFVRPFIMSVLFLVLSGICMYRITHSNNTTQLRQSYRPSGYETGTRGDQSAVTSQLDITVFLLLVSFMLCQAPFLLVSWLQYYFDFNFSVGLHYSVYLIFLAHLGGKFFIYTSTLPAFRNHFTSPCTKSRRNELNKLSH